MRHESVDAALKELEDALAVRPGPDLAARVRVEIERRRAEPWLRSVHFGLAVPALIVVGIVVVMVRMQPVPGRVLQAPMFMPPDDVMGRAADLKPVTTPAPTPQPRGRAGAGVVRDAPEFAPTGQSVALARLLDAIRRGGVSVAPEIVVTVQANEPLPEIVPIAIPSIKIEPLDTPPDEGGSRRPL